MLTKKQIAAIEEAAMDESVLKALLIDQTTHNNILWCTDDYAQMGEGYSFQDPIEIPSVTGEHAGTIKPRVRKDKEAQNLRSRGKAEVFTPSWVCNVQNNLIDNAWFGEERKRFNTEKDKAWVPNYYKVFFAPGKKTRSLGTPISSSLFSKPRPSVMK